MKSSLILSLIALFLLSACHINSKDEFMDRFEAFMDEVRTDRHNYDEADWEIKNEALSDLLENHYERFESEMSKGEKTRIWTQTVVYFTYQSGDELKRFWSENGENIRLQLDEHSELISEEMEEIWEEVMPELQEGLKDVIDGMQEIFND